jgi:hypothetical protein
LYKCDPAKLYEFFMKATQLVRLIGNKYLHFFDTWTFLFYLIKWINFLTEFSAKIKFSSCFF